MDLNADHLTSEIGLAIAAVINKHTRAANVGQPRQARITAHELRWQSEIVLNNGNVLSLSEW